MGLGSCSLGINKVEGWLDLVGHEFRVWLCLGGGTASLKFRQFKSAACDAFGMIFYFGSPWGCSFALWSVGALGLLAFGLLCC